MEELQKNHIKYKQLFKMIYRERSRALSMSQHWIHSIYFYQCQTTISEGKNRHKIANSFNAIASLCALKGRRCLLCSVSCFLREF